MDILYIPQLDEIAADGGAGESGGAARYRILKRVPEDGRVILTDRAITRVELASADAVTFTVPPLVKGAARDFFARIVITAEEIPEIVFAVPEGETVSFEDADEDVFKCEAGINLFAFTETDEGIFLVNRKRMDIELEVAFDPCGGEMAGGNAETYKLGASYGSLPQPSLDGHTFIGWFTEPDGGVEVKATDRCKTGVTRLYAHWEVYSDPFADDILTAGNLVFHTSGDAAWRIDPVVFASGSGSARSGAIGDDRSTSLTTVLNGAGRLSFKWKASSESGYDKMVFRIDGETKADISGERDWTEVSVEVSGGGPHTAEWRYSKDGSVANGSDCGWVDEVAWEPEGGA